MDDLLSIHSAPASGCRLAPFGNSSSIIHRVAAILPLPGDLVGEELNSGFKDIPDMRPYVGTSPGYGDERCR